MNSHRLRLALIFLFCLLSFISLKTIATHSQLSDGDSTLSSNPASLGLIPASGSVLVGEPVEVKLVAQTNDHTLTALESHLTFDPAKLHLDPASITGVHLPFTLPNCDGDIDTPPCPSLPVVQSGHASFYASVPCDEDGCSLNPSTGLVTLATFTFTPTASGRHLIDLTTSLDNPDFFTQLAAIGFDTNIATLFSDTHLTAQPCLLAHDFDADGLVSVADIMLVSSRWQKALGDPLYDGQFDSDQNGQLNIVDIQATANAWNQTCIN